jgi:hypothetical protein
LQRLGSRTGFGTGNANGAEKRSEALVFGRALTWAFSMNKAEILDFLPTLRPDERQGILDRLCDLQSKCQFSLLTLIRLRPPRFARRVIHSEKILCHLGAWHDPPVGLSPPGAAGYYTYEPCGDAVPRGLRERANRLRIALVQGSLEPGLCLASASSCRARRSTAPLLAHRLAGRPMPASRPSASRQD